MPDDSNKGFPIVSAAVALVFVLVGAAVAWGALSCGTTNFRLSLKDGLQLNCSGPPVPPRVEDDRTPGQIGFVYYGRKVNGDPSDGGKLRPADGTPLPLVAEIRAGAIFKGVDVKQLREMATNASAQVAKTPIGTCFRVIQVTNPKPFEDGEGAWLQVQVVRCP